MKISSWKPNLDPHWVCYACGVAANYLRCLKLFGCPPLEVAFGVSTYHNGTCEFCGKDMPVTEARDFFYPPFELLNDYVKQTYDKPRTKPRPTARGVVRRPNASKRASAKVAYAGTRRRKKD